MGFSSRETIGSAGALAILLMGCKPQEEMLTARPPDNCQPSLSWSKYFEWQNPLENKPFPSIDEFPRDAQGHLDVAQIRKMAEVAAGYWGATIEVAPSLTTVTNTNEAVVVAVAKRREGALSNPKEVDLPAIVILTNKAATPLPYLGNYQWHVGYEGVVAKDINGNTVAHLDLKSRNVIWEVDIPLEKRFCDTKLATTASQVILEQNGRNLLLVVANNGDWQVQDYQSQPDVAANPNGSNGQEQAAPIVGPKVVTPPLTPPLPTETPAPPTATAEPTAEPTIIPLPEGVIAADYIQPPNTLEAYYVGRSDGTGVLVDGRVVSWAEEFGPDGIYVKLTIKLDNYSGHRVGKGDFVPGDGRTKEIVVVKQGRADQKIVAFWPLGQSRYILGSLDQLRPGMTFKAVVYHVDFPSVIGGQKVLKIIDWGVPVSINNNSIK